MQPRPSKFANQHEWVLGAVLPLSCIPIKNAARAFAFKCFVAPQVRLFRLRGLPGLRVDHPDDAPHRRGNLTAILFQGTLTLQVPVLQVLHGLVLVNIRVLMLVLPVPDRGVAKR